jgi:hypothetical protein
MLFNSSFLPYQAVKQIVDKREALQKNLKQEQEVGKKVPTHQQLSGISARHKLFMSYNFY